MHRRGSHSAAAFTLIEITIVLVMVALIIGGILVGRNMVSNAELQSAVADFDMYRQAVLNYRDKYKELPGDHTAATGVTSADAGCDTPAASDVATAATCNGNGDGIIGDSTGNPLGAFTNYHESLLVWQHLANDGLLRGQYSGRRSTATSEITLGVNTPRTKMQDASFILRYFPTNTVTTGYFAATYGHVFFLGKPSTAANLPFNDAVLTTEQAKSIDQKIDDGMPGFGKVLTSPASLRPCPTTSSESTAVYDSSVAGAACALIFITGF